MPDLSPNVVVDELAVESGTIHVVRDDLLDGGTKQRAAVPFLLELKRQGVEELVYASPFSGFAQVALAVSCKLLGLKCTVFSESDPSASLAAGEPRSHSFSRLAAAHGASLRLEPDLVQAERSAARYEKEEQERFKIPLGFNHVGYREFLGREIAAQWKVLLQLVRRPIRNLWLPLGSGTLAQVFRKTLPSEVRISCVDVHVLPEQDPRVGAVRVLPNTEYYSAPERFAERAMRLPPVPSNLFYDAKLWRMIQGNAKDGDLWWNVAR
jgi:hypothetical protein